MGVKSTQKLSYGEAIILAVKLREEVIKVRSGFVWPYYLTDLELENELEYMDDALHDGESFRNYWIQR